MSQLKSECDVKKLIMMQKPEARTAGLKFDLTVDKSDKWTGGQGNCADLTGPGIEPQTSITDCVRLTTELTGQ